MTPLGDHERVRMYYEPEPELVHTFPPNHVATARGEYEKLINERGEEVFTGRCAGCGFTVPEGAPYSILYHPSKPGGLFHSGCSPLGGDWYGLEDE